MIIVSLLLIVVAVVLLGLGLVGGENGYLVSSIGASLLAAVALIVSGRRSSSGGRSRDEASAPDPVVPAQRAEPAIEAGTSDGDEPAQSPAGSEDAARVASATSPVYVVDGLPRYHRRDCSHTGDGERESIPVNEAIELGFTPCERCDPDSEILATA